ncbi:MAG: OmpA family protein [Alistipes sp.]|nr:OmpA family protein [Alistipes sp.]
MKKILLSLCVAVLACAAVSAQETATEKPRWKGVETNKFWHNWELSLGGGISHLDLNTRGGELGKVGANTGWNINGAATKWFHPIVGVRAQVDLGEFMNMIDNGTKFHTPYAYIHADAMLNLSNWIGGYREDRIYYAIPYLSFGYSATCFNRKDLHSNGEFSAGIGLLNKFRVTEYLDIQLDLRTWLLPGRGVNEAVLTPGKYAPALVGSVGVAYRFNKRDWNVAIQQTEVDGYLNAIDGLKKDLKHANDNINTVNDKCAELEEENAKLKKTVAPAAASVVNVETVVFFGKNEYELSAFGEAVVAKYVASVKDSDHKVTIVGHADNTTGTKEYNEKISQKRAEAVKAFIVANGIDESRIEVKWEGDSALPFADGDAEVNRCVVIK